MKNALLITLLFSCTLFFLTNCNDDSSAGIYSGCCDTAPVSFDYPGISIYVPNVFTPNFNGVNDRFRVFAHSDNSNTSSVKLEIQDRDRAILFSTENIEFGLNGGGN